MIDAWKDCIIIARLCIESYEIHIEMDLFELDRYSLYGILCTRLVANRNILWGVQCQLFWERSMSLLSLITCGV